MKNILILLVVCFAAILFSSCGTTYQTTDEYDRKSDRYYQRGLYPPPGYYNYRGYYDPYGLYPRSRFYNPRHRIYRQNIRPIPQGPRVIVKPNGKGYYKDNGKRNNRGKQ